MKFVTVLRRGAIEFDWLVRFHLGRMCLWVCFQLNCKTSVGHATGLVGYCMIDLHIGWIL